jgi:dihydrodipicolinate synthase/N-acetylneuraminate lyase
VFRGALAAAVTPLVDGGNALDEGALDPPVAFLVAGGFEGLLAHGPTVAGILLSPHERRRAAEPLTEPAGLERESWLESS